MSFSYQKYFYFSQNVFIKSSYRTQSIEDYQLTGSEGKTMFSSPLFQSVFTVETELKHQQHILIIHCTKKKERSKVFS